MNTDILKIETTPGAIDLNFEDAMAKITAEVEQYDVVVTEDTVADAKKLATMLNKRAQEISTRRKEAVAKASAPIKEADDKLKKLEGVCQEGRQRILIQVSKFEQKRLERAKSLLAAYRQEYWTKLGVREEFYAAEFDDLIKLGSLTEKGNLTAAASSELRERCQADKTVQDQTDRRLLELENRSYRAGLAAPLSRDHVKPFLFAEDDVYEKELDRIFRAEIEREKVAAARARQAQERAAPPPMDGHGQAVDAPAEPADRATPEPEPQPPTAPEPPIEAGKIRWTVTLQFELETNDSLTPHKVCMGAIKRMKEAGITTLTQVTSTGSNGEQDTIEVP